MLKKIVFTGVLTVLLLLFGMSEKNKYTDITRNNDWMQGAEVASNGNIADKCIINERDTATVTYYMQGEGA